MSTSARRQVAIITGGTRGIGLAVARLFHRQGYKVVVCSRSAGAAGMPSGVLHRRVDVRKRSALKRFVVDVVKRFGRLDVLVNCAGVSRWRAVGEIDEAFVEEVIDTNLLGALWGAAAASAVMRTGACIVNLSSLAGKRGSANNSAYCAAKFAVNGLTQALAKELGPRGIRVNAVCPVYVRTEHILSSLKESSSPASWRGEGRETGGGGTTRVPCPLPPAPQEKVEAHPASFSATQTALCRLPTAEEGAGTVYFLASPAASAITGQCVNVDCGTLPQ